MTSSRGRIRILLNLSKLVISTTSWREKVSFQSFDDELRFALAIDQHAELDFNVLAL